MRVHIAVLSAAIAAGPAAAAETMNIEPGLWEIEHKVEMPGGGTTSMPPMKQQQCLTEDDIAKGNEQLTHPKPAPGQKCRMLDHSHSDDTFTMNMSCTGDGHTSTVEGKVVFDTRHSYHGDFHITGTSQDGKTMHMTEHVSAKRVGDCKK